MRLDRRRREEPIKTFLAMLRGHVGGDRGGGPKTSHSCSLQQARQCGVKAESWFAQNPCPASRPISGTTRTASNTGRRIFPNSPVGCGRLLWGGDTRGHSEPANVWRPTLGCLRTVSLTGLCVLFPGQAFGPTATSAKSTPRQVELSCLGAGKSLAWGGAY